MRGLMFHLIAGVLPLSLFQALGSAAPITFSASDFGDSLWSTLVIYQHGAGGTAYGWHVHSGGHIGGYRRCRITLNAGDGPTAVWGFHRCLPFGYDPETQGDIVSIDYYEYALAIKPPSGGHNTGPGVRQDGVVYRAAGLFAYESSWTRKSMTGLRASDFTPVGGPSSAHPDFSSTGSPLEVGFVTGYSTPSTQHSSYSVDIGIDNWTFIIYPIPEPATLALLVLGGCLALLRRSGIRRRREELVLQRNFLGGVSV